METIRSCDCGWDECHKLKGFFDKCGTILQRGLFQLESGGTKKSIEFLHCIQAHIGPLPERKRIYIANYHWNPSLLEYMKDNNSYRTTPISKVIASSFGITAINDSVNHEAKKFYAVPNVPKGDLFLEMKSCQRKQRRLETKLKSNERRDADLKEIEQNADLSKLKISRFEIPTVQGYDEKSHSQTPILQVDDKRSELTNKSRCIEIAKDESRTTVISAEECERVLKQKWRECGDDGFNLNPDVNKVVTILILVHGFNETIALGERSYLSICKNALLVSRNKCDLYKITRYRKHQSSRCPKCSILLKHRLTKKGYLPKVM